MDQSLPLKGIKIVDLSMRLPGPLASYHLEKLGAHITKFENTHYPDSFSIQDNLFKDWYHQLNIDKEIIKEAFPQEETKIKLHKLIKESDGAIIGLPLKIQRSLGIDKDSLLKLDSNKVFIYIYASQKENTPLHDLGALAKSKLLAFHLAGHGIKSNLIPPPFLPLAGINFANSICNHFLSGMIWSLKNNTSFIADMTLSTQTDNLAKALLPSRKEKITLFDHNGANPFYYIYKMSDQNYIVLSLLEEKFKDYFLKAIEGQSWKNLSDEKLFKKLSDYLIKQTKKEMRSLVQEHQLQCIDFTSLV